MEGADACTQQLLDPVGTIQMTFTGLKQGDHPSLLQTIPHGRPAAEFEFKTEFIEPAEGGRVSRPPKFKVSLIHTPPPDHDAADGPQAHYVVNNSDDHHNGIRRMGIEERDVQDVEVPKSALLGSKSVPYCTDSRSGTKILSGLATAIDHDAIKLEIATVNFVSTGVTKYSYTEPVPPTKKELETGIFKKQKKRKKHDLCNTFKVVVHLDVYFTQGMLEYEPAEPDNIPSSEVINMETNGARPRCCEDADMAVLLENIEFRTFKDEQARLQTVVNVHGENNADEDRELSAQPSASDGVRVRLPPTILSDEVITPQTVRDAVLKFTAPTTWDTEFPGPSGLKCTLFAYQRRALAWMAWRESSSNATKTLANGPCQNAMAEKYAEVLQAQACDLKENESGYIDDEGGEVIPGCGVNEAPVENAATGQIIGQKRARAEQNSSAPHQNHTYKNPDKARDRAAYHCAVNGGASTSKAAFIEITSSSGSDCEIIQPDDTPVMHGDYAQEPSKEYFEGPSDAAKRENVKGEGGKLQEHIQVKLKDRKMNEENVEEAIPAQKRAETLMLDVNADMSAHMHEHPLWERVTLQPGANTAEPQTIHVSHALGRVRGSPAGIAPQVPGGILAEEMGLGKTVEVISLILLHRPPEAQKVPLRAYPRPEPAAPEKPEGPVCNPVAPYLCSKKPKTGGIVINRDESSDDDSRSESEEIGERDNLSEDGHGDVVDDGCGEEHSQDENDADKAPDTEDSVVAARGADAEQDAEAACKMKQDDEDNLEHCDKRDHKNVDVENGDNCNMGSKVEDRASPEKGAAGPSMLTKGIRHLTAIRRFFTGGRSKSEKPTATATAGCSTKDDIQEGKRKHESNNEEQSERPAKSPKLGTTALAKAKEARRAERRRKKEQTREEEQRKKEEERKRKEEEYKQALEDWKNGREIDITQSFAGTLVVVPPTLVQQWVHEIGVHSDLNVHVYDGLKEMNRGKRTKKAEVTAATAREDARLVNAIHDCQLSDQVISTCPKLFRTKDDERLVAAEAAQLLANADVVITTYSVLRDEVYMDGSGGKWELRHAKSHPTAITPLTRLKWWRLVMDEAQMVGTRMSLVSQMARRISTVHRWCVTGTPMGENALADLQGVLSVLCHNPFQDPRLWKALVATPIAKGDPAGSRRLRAVLRPLMWRSTKAHAARDHPLPPRSVHKALLCMPPVEQTFYQHILAETRNVQGEVHAVVASGAPWENKENRKRMISTYARAKRTITELRKACIHPQLTTYWATLSNELQLGNAGALGPVEIMQRMLTTGTRELQAGERDVCASLAATAMLLGQLGAETLEKGHQKLLEHCAEDPSCWMGCEGLIQINPFIEAQKHTAPKLKDMLTAKEKWGHQLIHTDIYKAVMGSDIGEDGDTGRTENVPVGKCSDSDEGLRSKTVTMVLKLLKLSRHIEDEGIGRDGTLDTMDASDIPEGSDEDESTKIETQMASWMAWKHMGITNSTLQAIAHAAVGDMHAAVAAVRKVRDHASALRETATDRHSEVVQKRKEKEKEVLQAREQVTECWTKEAEAVQSIGQILDNAAATGQPDDPTRPPAIVVPAEKFLKDLDSDLRSEGPNEALSSVADTVRKLRTSVDTAINCHTAHATAQCMGCMVTLLSAGNRDIVDVDDSDCEDDVIVVTGVSSAARKKLQGHMLSHDMPQEVGLLRAALLGHTARAVNAARCLKQLRNVEAITFHKVPRVMQDVDKLAHDLGRRTGGMHKTSLQALTRAKNILDSRNTLLRKTRELLVLDERVYEKQEAVDKQKQHAVEKLRESGQAMRAATASVEDHGDKCLERLMHAAEQHQARCKEVASRQRFLQNQLEELKLQLAKNKSANDYNPSSAPVATMENVATGTQNVATGTPCTTPPTTLRQAKHNFDLTADIPDTDDISMTAHSSNPDSKKHDGTLTCPICMCCMDDDIRLLPCGHSFCRECLDRIIHDAGNGTAMCPMDRRPFKENQIFSAKAHAAMPTDHQHPEVSPEDPEIADIKPSGAWLTKVNALLRRVLWLQRTAPEEKCLIFSQFPEALTFVRNALAINNVKCASIISNNKKDMRAALNAFHEDPDSRVFLLCLGAAAAGLTLTRANHVYLLEPGLDPAIEQQAVARVHRYGQTRPVKIVRLLIQDTVEPVVLKHSEQRLALFQSANEAEEGLNGKDNDTEAVVMKTVGPSKEAMQQEDVIDILTSLFISE